MDPNRRCTILARISPPDHSDVVGFRPSWLSSVLLTVCARAHRIFCTKATSQRCESFYSITARPSFRTIAVSHSYILNQGDGDFYHLAATKGQYRFLRTSTNLEWPSCFEALIPLTSELDID